MKRYIVESPVPTVRVWVEDGIGPDDMRKWGHRQAKELIKEEWPGVSWDVDAKPPKDGEIGLCRNRRKRIVDCTWNKKTSQWIPMEDAK